MSSVRQLKTACPTCGAPLHVRYEVERSMGDSGLVPVSAPICEQGHVLHRSADDPLPE